METEHLIKGLAFFCLAAAFWLWYFRAGKRLKEQKGEIERLEKKLEELGKPDEPGDHQMESKGPE